MDQLDHKILWHLDHNARFPLTELAKQVGISKQSANYRLNKLTREGIIRGFISSVDIHSLGYLTYRLYLRYRNTDKDTEEKIIQYLVNHDHTLWVVSTAGSWDLEVVFTARNFVHFNSHLKQLKYELGLNFSKYNISMSVVSYHFKRDYLLGLKRELFRPTFYGFEPRAGKWDKLDISIISELAINCRQSNDELGRKLGVTYHTIKHRISKLEADHILQSHRILLDLEKVKRQYIKVLVTFRTISKEVEEQFFRHCCEKNFVIYLTEVLGDWQLEIETEVEHRDEITELLRELRMQFPEVISDYEFLEVTREHKLNYFPMGERLWKEDPQAVFNLER